MLGLIFIQVFPSKERFCQTIFLFVGETPVINPLTTILYFGLYQAGLYDAPGILHMNSFPNFLSPANFEHMCQFCEWNPRANKELEDLCLDIVVPSSLSAQPLVHGSHSWADTLNSLKRSQGEHGHLKMSLRRSHAEWEMPRISEERLSILLSSLENNK